MRVPDCAVSIQQQSVSWSSKARSPWLAEKCVVGVVKNFMSLAFSPFPLAGSASKSQVILGAGWLLGCLAGNMAAECDYGAEETMWL